MYIPELFRVDDPATLFGFIGRYNFGTIISGGAKPDATHLPFLVDAARGERGVLVAYFARANPYWKTLDLLGESLVSSDQNKREVAAIMRAKLSQLG